MQKRNVKIFGKGKGEPLPDIFLKQRIKTLFFKGLGKLIQDCADHLSLIFISSFHLTLNHPHQSYR